MTTHLTEDDLVLHFYGEMDPAAESEAVSHLAGCDQCRRSYTQLQRVLAAVDAMPTPALPEVFERIVWARLESALPPRRGWLRRWMLGPANLVWAAAVILLVAGAFFAGRLTNPPAGENATPMASAVDIQERILLSDIGEHLDRSQAMLIELVTAEQPDGRNEVDISLERERAEELVAANRLYRQSASGTGNSSVTQLLDELERLLVELAASPDPLSGEAMERVQQRVAAKDLLFKVRVVSTALRARQQHQQQTGGRAGA
ncbi:MAG: hypothetical protein H0W53_04755 [Acidobacteria bacterium]|nr:hypothetical protein [Acidobacteriota bacterium]